MKSYNKNTNAIALPPSLTIKSSRKNQVKLLSNLIYWFTEVTLMRSRLFNLKQQNNRLLDRLNFFEYF